VNGPETPVGNELDIRALRYFVAVAEELHFTRAATRLFVAQQALSREIRRLEARLGVPLFVRTTRRVTLTPDGERLLVRARELVAQHDAIWADLRAPSARPVIVDLLSEGRMTGVRVLERARIDAAEVEFRSRYGGGAGTALEKLVAGMLDVVFGRLDWLDAPDFPTVERRLLRLEPLALLLPAAHPLSAQESIPIAALEGLEIDGLPPDTHAPEWTDLVRQFLVLAKARSTPPHITAVGLEEQAYHLVRQGVPILTSIDHVAVPGGVVRPLVEPIPLYPWSMGWRRDAEGPGLAALRAAAVGVAEAEGWMPHGSSGADRSWLPEPDSTRVSSGVAVPVGG
jgi:DNA-binding transcriptional LysR family regulator